MEKIVHGRPQVNGTFKLLLKRKSSIKESRPWVRDTTLTNHRHVCIYHSTSISCKHQSYLDLFHSVSKKGLKGYDEIKNDTNISLALFSKISNDMFELSLNCILPVNFISPIFKASNRVTADDLKIFCFHTITM